MVRRGVARRRILPCQHVRCVNAPADHAACPAAVVSAAVQCFEEACRLVPGSVPYLSMAAKCWSDLTFYYDVRSDRERQLVNLKAIEYAEKVGPADSMACCVCG